MQSRKQSVFTSDEIIKETKLTEPASAKHVNGLRLNVNYVCYITRIFLSISLLITHANKFLHIGQKRDGS